MGVIEESIAKRTAIREAGERHQDRLNESLNEAEGISGQDFHKMMGKSWRIEDNNGVYIASKKDGDRLKAFTLRDESQKGTYYALEYKESNLKGNDVNYDTLTKSKGVKTKLVAQEIKNILKKVNENLDESIDEAKRKKMKAKELIKELQSYGGNMGITVFDPDSGKQFKISHVTENGSDLQLNVDSAYWAKNE